MEIELVNKLYDLYLMLLGGYVILLIGTVGYMIEMFRLYKKHKVFEEKMEQEIINKYEV